MSSVTQCPEFPTTFHFISLELVDLKFMVHKDMKVLSMHI